jgi:hypothetical protein
MPAMKLMISSIFGVALGLALAGGAALAQSPLPEESVHLPNGTRYINCFNHGCYDGVILDRPNSDVCEALAYQPFERQRYFCHK